ncbi:MAG: hypothetical protein HY394_06050 [Candidatus Diapherotrites archaeon]|nr:hypothetical protein [Candidatus Diapherotrites archaeon]
MRGKGFFAFVLVIFFLLAATESAGRQSSSFRSFSEAHRIAMELESQNMLRSNVENNLDFVVEKTMRRQILLGSTDPAQLKLALDEKVFSFFLETQKNARPRNLEFSGATVYGNRYSENAGAAAQEKLSMEFIGRNSVAFVELAGGAWIAEYHFSGGLYRNSAVIGRIVSEDNETMTVFFLPAGYSKTVVVVG